MRKEMWIVLFLLTIMMSACGKKETEKPEKEKAPIDIQVPTEKPTEEPARTELPTEEPVKSDQPEENLMENTVKIMDYFRMDLPEEYTTLIDDKNHVVTIGEDGKKVGRITLKQSYRGKHEAAVMVKELLEKEGYAKSVKTYQKGNYLMTKIMMETGLTKEDIQSGKLFSGNEELIYLYYRNEIPTTVLMFETTNPKLEAAMDRIAETIELLR